MQDRIVGVRLKAPPAELGLPAVPMTCVSIFLSVFDVHINRAPVAGRVARSVYVPGTFLNAALDKASEENERRCVVIATPGGPEMSWNPRTRTWWPRSAGCCKPAPSR